MTKIRESKKVNILGVPHEVNFVSDKRFLELEGVYGWYDFTTKEMKILDMESIDGEDNFCDLPRVSTNSTIRHEVIHAFLSESGLRGLEWAQDESIIDYFAEQFPKLYKVFEELDCLD